METTTDNSYPGTSNPYLRFRGRAREAVYRTAELERWQCNPLEEALPRVIERDEMMDFLLYLPPYDESSRYLSSELRLYLLPDVARFLMPTDKHLDLFRKVSMLIRAGYEQRNPISRDYPGYVSGDHSREEGFDWEPPAGTLFTGISGTGKTLAAQRIFSYFDQVIYHNHYGDRRLTMSQVSWLKLDCPKDGRVKGLCISFFQSVDSLLGTNYHREYVGRGRTSVASLIAGMQQVAKIINLGLLAIDETQLLYELRQKASDQKDAVDELINTLVQLENDIGAPLMLIGTPGAKMALGGKLRIARRASSTGDVEFIRMKEDDEEYQQFTEALWRYQFTRIPTALTDEFRHILYDESQGIRAIEVAVYKNAQYRAIVSGQERITARLLRMIIKSDYPRLVEPLRKLRTGKATDLDAYDDTFMNLIGDLTIIPEPSPHRLEVASTKKADVHLPPQPAPKRARKPRSKTPITLPEGSLQWLQAQAAESGKTIHEILAEKGYICSLEDFAL